MPEHKCDMCTTMHQIRRIRVEINLGLAQILKHYGLPPVTDEDIDEFLAKEGIKPPVKSLTAKTGHLSTGDLVIHRRPHSAPANLKEM